MMQGSAGQREGRMKIIGHLITFMDRLNRLLLGLCKLAMIVLVGAIAADIFVGVF